MLFTLAATLLPFIPSIVVLMMLLTSATRCIKEVKHLFTQHELFISSFFKLQIQEKTALLVHDIHVFIDDDELRNLIADFSLLIKQAPKHFNARNFFVIDYTLLGKILSSMMTLLVIFISFQPETTE